jgi:hypothetical protein
MLLADTGYEGQKGYVTDYDSDSGTFLVELDESDKDGNPNWAENVSPEDMKHIV